MRELSGRDGIRKCGKSAEAYGNRLDVPVYIGVEKPLRREYVNALDTHGEDGLGESFLPEVEGFRQEMGAVEFLSKLKEEHISVIALGPMTNLATLLEQDRVAFDQIEEFGVYGRNVQKPWKLFAGSGIQLLV